jgi:hypothetical protein
MARKGYHAERLPWVQPVLVTCGGISERDAIKGLNRGHAMYRARENWPACTVKALPGGHRATRWED